MLKKKTKIVVLLLAVLLIVSTFSFATDTPVTTSEEGNVTSTLPGDNARTDEAVTNEVTNEEDIPIAETPEIYSGDLYVFDDDINMDQLVDGNVFLFGNNINVTGKVNGSLYAFGNNVTFAEDSYIVQSIYVMANQLTLNGSANDLYALANKVDMSFDSFMIRDLRVAAETFNFNGGVGRDAFVEANNFNFVTTEGDAAVVYGNLTYSSANELSLTPDLVEGEINYRKVLAKEESITEKILDKVVDICNTILYVLVVFFLCLWLAPKFLKNISNSITPSNCAKSFGIGLLTLIAAVVAGIALLFTVVGVPVGFAVIAVFVLLLSIATAVSATAITYKLKEKFAYSKNYMTYLTLVGVVIVIWLLKLIPFIGWLISFVVKMIGLGIVVYYLFTKNKENNNETTEPVVKTEKKEDSSKKNDKKDE